MLIIKSGETEYSKIFETVIWKGELETSTRELEFTVLKEEKKNFELGEEVSLIVDKELLFRGNIQTVSEEANNELMTINCFDNGFMLNNNQFIKNYYKANPWDITYEICGELGIEVVDLPDPLSEITFPAFGMSGFEIISNCWKIQGMKNNKVYSITFYNNYLSIVESGVIVEDFKLESFSNIREASYSKSSEEIINKLLLYTVEKKKPQIIGSVSNEDSIEKYGVRQQIQEYISGELAFRQYKKKTEKEYESSTMLVDGNVGLVSGYSVPVKIKTTTELNGIFLIKNDTHIWTSNDYTVELELQFDGLSYDQDLKDLKKKKKNVKVETKEFKPEEVSR